MLDNIDLFIQLVDVGSFTELAKLNFLSQSTISRRMERLEEKLKVSLFVPNLRKMELTEEGEQVYQYFKQNIHQLRDSVGNFLVQKDDVYGNLTVVIPPMFVNFILNDKLLTFLDTYPQINLHVLSSFYNPNGINNFDVAIVCTFPNREYMTSKLLFEDQPILLASKRYLAKFGSPQNLDDLPKHRLVMPIINVLPETDLNFTDAEGNHRQILIDTPLISTENGSLMFNLLTSGQAIVPMFGFIAQKLMREDDSLVQLLPEWELAPLRVHIIRPNRLKNQKVEKFLAMTCGEWLTKN